MIYVAILVIVVGSLVYFCTPHGPIEPPDDFFTGL